MPIQIAANKSFILPQQENKKTSLSPEPPKEAKQLQSTEPKQKRYPMKYGYHFLKYDPRGKTPDQIEQDYQLMINRFWGFVEPFFPQFLTLFSYLSFFLERYFSFTKKEQNLLIRDLNKNLPDYWFYHFPIWIINLLKSRPIPESKLNFSHPRLQLRWDAIYLLGPQEIALYEFFKPDSEPPFQSSYLNKIFTPWFLGKDYDPTGSNIMYSWKPKPKLLEMILSREMELEGDKFLNSFFIRHIYLYCFQTYSIKMIPPKILLTEKQTYEYYQAYLNIAQDPSKIDRKALYESWDPDRMDLRTHRRRIELMMQEQEIKSHFLKWISKYPLPPK